MENTELNEYSLELNISLTRSLYSTKSAIKELKESHNKTLNKLEQHIILESISKLLLVETNIKMIMAEDDED